MSRVCGTCTMCCKLPGVVEEGVIDKAPGVWCEHCDRGVGCRIYETRPQPCRNFECLWLQNESLPDELKPENSHVVMFEVEEKKSEMAMGFVIMEDPSYFQFGESLKSKLVQQMIRMVRSTGMKVAVENNGKCRLI